MGSVPITDCGASRSDLTSTADSLAARATPLAWASLERQRPGRGGIGSRDWLYEPWVRSTDGFAGMMPSVRFLGGIRTSVRKSRPWVCPSRTASGGPLGRVPSVCPGPWARVFNLRSMTESEKRTIEVRRLVAEAIGTFTLTLVACSAEVVPAVLNQPPDDLVAAVAPGLTVLVVICAIGDVSGAHINPVVTLGFALRRAFPWRRVPGYLVAQVLGAQPAGYCAPSPAPPATSG
jgi:Major intrinsic protein